MAWIRAEGQLADTDYDKLKVISELLCVQIQHHCLNLDTFSMIVYSIDRKWPLADIHGQKMYEFLWLNE